MAADKRDGRDNAWPIAAESREIRAVVHAMLDREVSSFVSLRRGGNSRVFKVTLEDGGDYIVKYYFRDVHDQRNRLDTEFRALQFLHERGFGNVPQPIAADHTGYLGIYAYMEGVPVTPESITIRDVEACVAFLIQLRSRGLHPSATALPSASEACFSVEELVANIRNRLTRLRGVPGSGKENLRCRSFLHDDLTPVFHTLTEHCRQSLAMNSPLPAHQRTLSPSDFGFHNALRKDGALNFVDFEYFGWDDPVKTVSDFLLHPAMDLSEDLKIGFIDEMDRHWPEMDDVKERLPYLYPLYGLKWCTIILNEFLPEHWGRRLFADASVDLDVKLSRQLEKAHVMLEHIKAAHRTFPY